MAYTRLPSPFPDFPSKSHTLINPNPREMNFPPNIFGSTPDPLPTEDTEATVKASTRSANLVIMGEYCYFLFALHLTYSLLTIYYYR